ncbi:putative AT DNA binding protein (Thy28) [Cladophialophora carrionii]|uniref:Thymocyte nuclear protein 1 n=1 Tax=Cladophialophora carrionii TaxID=86049 RepID=A0A1C1CEG6_9EURO|nr:putative AT DNA binding protein (Thy28) [Cladophialophora carrionii]
MPLTIQARKRKAASNPGTPAKKVRIGSTTNIPDSPTVSPSGRPKRTSVGEPQYKFTRRRSSSTQNVSPAVAEPKPAAKRRGRPPKAAAAAPTPAAEENVTAKKRGRPAKITKSASTPKPAASSAKTAPAVTSQKPQPKASVTVPARRGRKPKALTEAVQPDSEFDSEPKPEDPVARANGAATAVDGDKSKPDDLSSIDPDVQYWLMKAEPESRIEKGHDVKFSIDDLAAKTEPEAWDGVRNPMARNHMRAMRKGDLAFFYHSNCSVPGIAGVMRIVAEHSVDESAFNPDHPYFDPKSDRANPKWEVVHVEFVKKFENFITLRELKTFAKPGGALEEMQMLKLSRLSVSAVSPEAWRFILELAGEPSTLGHGDGMSGYESEIDGEGEDTAGVSDADGLNGISDGQGLGVAGGVDLEESAANVVQDDSSSNAVNGADVVDKV